MVYHTVSAYLLFIGCILYRRLLLQSRKLPNLKNPQIILLSTIIKAKFRKNVRLQPFKSIIAELELGYRALYILTALNRTSIGISTRIGEFLSQLVDIGAVPDPRTLSPWPFSRRLGSNSIKSALTSPIERSESFAKTPESSTRENAVVKASSRAIPRARNPFPVLSRPYPQLSGKRHIPRLVAANGVPFLRIKKPQPPLLSRIIRCAINRRNAINARIQRLEDEELAALVEDRWDALVDAELSGHKDKDTGRPRNELRNEQRQQMNWRSIGVGQAILENNGREEDWIFEVQRALEEERDRMRALNMKRSVTARNMWAVVKAERALQKKEEMEGISGRSIYEEPQAQNLPNEDKTIGIAAQAVG